MEIATMPVITRAKILGFSELSVEMELAIGMLQ